MSGIVEYITITSVKKKTIPCSLCFSVQIELLNRREGNKTTLVAYTNTEVERLAHESASISA